MSTFDSAPEPNIPPHSAELSEHPVTLVLPKPVEANYDVGAEELRAELGISEITAELLMQVCLAAPAVDDLVLGFIRDDLRVVSRSEQTRNVFERDLVLAQKEAGKLPASSLRKGSLGDLLQQRSREIKAKAGAGKRSELDVFVHENRQVYQDVCALSHEDLTRWVMLGLMREMESRRRGSLASASSAESPVEELHLNGLRKTSFSSIPAILSQTLTFGYPPLTDTISPFPPVRRAWIVDARSPILPNG